MEAKELLNTYRLEFCFPTEDKAFLDEIRETIKQANQNYVLLVEEKCIGSYTNFYITCPTTGFANAYYHLGIKMAPIIKKYWNHNLF